MRLFSHVLWAEFKKGIKEKACVGLGGGKGKRSWAKGGKNGTTVSDGKKGINVSR